MPVITMANVRGVIERGLSGQAVRARELVTSGGLLPDDLFGALLAEAVGQDAALLVGRPRTEMEFDAFVRASGHAVSVVHLDAAPALVDARMAAAGLGPSEKEHPGALARLRAALHPLLARADATGSLLTLDASLPRTELVAAAARFIKSRQSD